MKAAKFLVPVSILAAAMVSQHALAHSTPNASDQSSATKLQADSSPLEKHMDVVSGEDLFRFVLTRAANGQMMASHRSHVSHSSHASHTSHTSHYSSTPPPPITPERLT